MTYSLTEKEEILYERQIDELFNLTEVTPLVGDKELKTYTDPATGQAYEVDPATAVRLKKADATAHWSDRYRWDEHPKVIPAKPVEPTVEIDPDDTEYVDPPVLPIPIGLRTGPEIKPPLGPKKPIIPPWEEPKKIIYDPLTGKKIGTGKPLKQIPYTSDHGLIKGPAGKQIQY
ncbi:MAG: hypothetical protein CMD91_04085, partial [Gammaproteobacteria bacterium]|nr:hypothetical protein [Gammaproteobacteria bacterium]